MNDDSELVYIDTKKQAAEIFTEAFVPNLWDGALEMLGIHKNCQCPPPGGEDPRAN